MIPLDLKPSRVGSGQHLERGWQSTGIGRSKAEASSHLAPSEAASHSRSTQGVGRSQTSLSAPSTTAPTALAGPPAIHKSCTQHEAVEKRSPASRSEAAEQQCFLSSFFNLGHLGGTGLHVQSSPLLETLRWASCPGMRPRSSCWLHHEQWGPQPPEEREKERITHHHYFDF